jgi:hypothetical protein
MLGVKSNREPIRGAFAAKVREQIAAARTEPQKDQEKVHAKASEESRK